MEYTMTSPCDACPFLKSMKRGFPIARLQEFAAGSFHCHKTGTQDDDGNYVATKDSLACAGALIFNEKRGAPKQMMRICERLGMYDRTKLNMNAKVR